LEVLLLETSSLEEKAFLIKQLQHQISTVFRANVFSSHRENTKGQINLNSYALFHLLNVQWQRL